MFHRVFILACLSLYMAGCIPQADSQSTSPKTSTGASPYASLYGDLVIQSGESINLEISAYDADSIELTYEASNLPDWVALDTETGSLTGSPGSNDVGVYTDIRFAISDGINSTVIGPFTLEVVGQLYSATVNWQPVTSDENDEDISNVEGYILQWGAQPDVYDYEVFKSGQQSNSHMVKRLKAGNYYFSMMTILTSGIKSERSDVFQIQIGES